MTKGRGLTIAIRAASERTAECCRRLACEQAPWATIEVVQERPFEAALRKTYEIGIGSNADWTMTLDADVLLRRGAIDEFVAAAERLPSDFVQIEGRVHDKLLGVYRQAGHRIYRTSLLPQALALVPDPGTEMRPEFSVLYRLALRGFPSRRIGTVMGIHDYEQYYRDLYRKAFVHAKKHPEFIPQFISRIKALLDKDDDFLIVLIGLWKGLEHTGSVRIDVGAFPDITPVLHALGMEEKRGLDPGAIEFGYVERCLAEGPPAETMPEYDLQTTGEWGGGTPEPPQRGIALDRAPSRVERMRGTHRLLKLLKCRALSILRGNPEIQK
jgi:hypothetical protein